MSDGMFFVGILGFFFVLWFIGGGPSRPISFAGPFITPITNAGQSQTGYGKKIAGSVSVGGSTISTGTQSGPSTSTTKIPNTSPYTGKIFLDHYVNNAPVPDPSQEYLGLQVLNTVTQGIDITGWTIRSTVTGNSVSIPQGATMLTIGRVQIAPIILQASNIASITTGFSPVNVSYERNTCTNFLSIQSQYAECFAARSARPGFLSGNWQIYLNRGSRLWLNTGDTIELLDANGKVVDSFSN